IFTNIIQHFKIVNSWTPSDLQKWGPSTFLYPDNPLSAGYTSAAGGFSGDGIWNNLVAPPLYTSMAFWKTKSVEYNDGYLKRMQNFYNNASGSNALVEFDTGGTKASQVGRANWLTSGNGAVWQMVLTLPLKQLHDFFNKLPILKSARIDLTINFNSCNGTFTYTSPAAESTIAVPAADGSWEAKTNNQTSGHCNPVMISSAAATLGTSGVGTASANYMGQPNAFLRTSANATVTVKANINGSGTGVSSTIFNGCRWYVTLYELDPKYQANLIATNPLKTIYYDDFYCYTNITNQSGAFQSLLASGVPNPKYLLLFPFYSANKYGSNKSSQSPYQSFFGSEPATTSQVSLTNFQVQCGGKTIFPLIEQYDFQQYIEEFSSIFAYNGGKAPCMTSGLWSQLKWQNSPVYVVDIGRRVPQDVEVNKSVQISATINSVSPVDATGAIVDIIAFVIYQRSATFNIVNGL